MKRLLAALVLVFASPPAAEALDILVFGATGKVGRHVVAEALDRGHRVTAVSRDPARIDMDGENLEKARGDLLDPQSVRALLGGRDVVVISVRGVAPGARSGEGAIVRIGVENVVNALREARSAARLIHVGGSGTLEIRPGVTLAERLPKFFLPRDFELELEGQQLVLDYLESVDDVAWTYLTPPRSFTPGPRTGRYRIGGDRLMEDTQGKSRISRADFAVALIDEAESAAHPMQRIQAAY
ncbi:MAG: NAD(P)H-binding protein [Lysobacterales bacterium]